MKKSNQLSPEVRERTLRMVQEHRGEYECYKRQIQPQTGSSNLNPARYMATVTR